MDDPDNNSDAEKPKATQKHSGKKQHDEDEHKQEDLDEHKQYDEDEHKQQDDDKQHDEGRHHGVIEQHDEHDHNSSNETAARVSYSPQSSHAQKLINSPNSEHSTLSSGSGSSGSSSGSLYDRYFVQDGALRIYRGSAEATRDCVEVPQDSTEHLEMRACVNIAMRILGRTQNREAMVTYSVGVVDFMEERYKRSTAGDLKVYEEMDTTISNWLDKLGAAFPDLYISPSLGSCFGYTSRKIWGDYILDYKPPLAAEISIHSGIFQKLCALKQRLAKHKTSFTDEWQSKLRMLEGAVVVAEEGNDTKVTDAAKIDLQEYQRRYREKEKLCNNYEIHYERSLFHLAVTLTHECFHVLTGYWTGFVKEFTPPKYYGAFPIGGLKGPDEPDETGEAGDWWEYKHGFNGSVNLVWNIDGRDKGDPYPLDDQSMSAGIPFLRQTRTRDDGSIDGEEWTRISHNFIRDYIKKGVSSKAVRALGATPIDSEDFCKTFMSVVDTSGTEKLTYTSPGHSAKAGAPQRDRSLEYRLPIVCKDCGHGQQSVPLGCRGPKPAANPPA